jgi:phospholipid/cholesterol/gamma-HCH transport system permease protein
MQRVVRRVGRRWVAFFQYVGGLVLLTGQIVRALPRAWASRRLVLAQMFTVGVQSLPLVVLVSVFTGAVSTWQAAYQFQGYLPMRYLGGAVGKAILLELGPVLTALVMAGRVGAAMAAELGTMRVTEQVDALEVMGIDPVRYLVMPRVVSGVIMMPVLVLFANFVAILGALAVAIFFVNISSDLFLNGFKLLFRTNDLWAGLVKALTFGLIIALVGCYQGFTTRGGAEGVGRATTGAVVVASVLILISNYLIATVLFRI